METPIADPSKAAQMAGQHVHWRVVQRYFGKLKDESHLRRFEPHVQPEDLHWRRAESLLYELDSGMEFYKDRDWVGMDFDGAPVTLNFVDIALGYSNDIAYEDRYVYHFVKACGTSCLLAIWVCQISNIRFCASSITI